MSRTSAKNWFFTPVQKLIISIYDCVRYGGKGRKFGGECAGHAGGSIQIFLGFLLRFWANPKMKDKGYDGRLKPISS